MIPQRGIQGGLDMDFPLTLYKNEVLPAKNTAISFTPGGNSLCPYAIPSEPPATVQKNFRRACCHHCILDQTWRSLW
ncbi:hypothetical protein ACKS0A_10846 [Histoplasma ohiense]